jgi:predicted nucleotidyltransferase
MKPAPLLGRLARRIGSTGLGRRAGAAVYGAAARAAARHLAPIPGVTSVYLTGSVARGEADPGHSDVDLVVVGDCPTAAAEATLLRRLSVFQSRAAILGGLFYNLDYLDVREVPFARAFGGNWEMRLDAEGQALSGERLWDAACVRPAAEVRAERFSSALRRWLNTGSRLLDPDVRDPLDVRARDALRLLSDLRDLSRPEPTRTGRGGAGAPGPAPDATDALLGAAFDALHAFAVDVAKGFAGPIPKTAGAPEIALAPELRRWFDAVTNSPVRSGMLVGRGAGSSDLVPVLLVDDELPGADAVRVARERFGRTPFPRGERTTGMRRPVPLSASMWRALYLMEPAPFAGAAATQPVVVAGAAPPEPKAPGPELVAALVRARIVQSFALCRGPALRPKLGAAHRERSFAERFSLLRALDRAVDDEVFDVTLGRRHDALSPEERAAVLRDFSERHRKRLAPALEERLRSPRA